VVLAAIVSEDRPDLPDGPGLPPSLLTDLMGQIRCDMLSLDGWDAGRQMCWFSQEIPSGIYCEALAQVFWANYWDGRYPTRTGDLRSVIMTADFYSVPRVALHWHVYRSRPPVGVRAQSRGTPAQGAAANRRARPLRAAELDPRSGPEFSERDRAVLTLLAPHLDQAYLDAERRRHPVPRLTPRHWDLLKLVAAGHTNTQIARRLGISEGTVGTHLENVYGRLNVSSRTAAVTRAFPDRVAY